MVCAHAYFVQATSRFRLTAARAHLLGDRWGRRWVGRGPIGRTNARARGANRAAGATPVPARRAPSPGPTGRCRSRSGRRAVGAPRRVDRPAGWRANGISTFTLLHRRHSAEPTLTTPRSKIDAKAAALVKMRLRSKSKGTSSIFLQPVISNGWAARIASSSGLFMPVSKRLLI